MSMKNFGDFLKNNGHIHTTTLCIYLSVFKGQVTLVQVGVMSGQAYIFDVSADTKIWDELKAVLECNHVVKVFHDCRNISSVLSAQLDINLCNTFDAQVR